MVSTRKAEPGQLLRAALIADEIFGFGLRTLDRASLRVRPAPAAIADAEIKGALLRRKEARASRDFSTSDAIRDDLHAKGVEVMDGDPLEWDWRIEV
jgi:cysteinyl-tRNA synthetase